MTAVTKVLITVAALAGGALIAGCAGGNADPPAQATAITCVEPHGLGLIIGAHRDVPAPRPSATVQCELQDAISHREQVSIVIADGQPAVRILRLAPVTGGTRAGQKARMTEDARIVLAAVSDSRPSNPGVDDLTALAVASGEARSLGHRMRRSSSPTRGWTTGARSTSPRPACSPRSPATSPASSRPTARSRTSTACRSS